MPSIKDLKKRIGAVKNTQQTTKAMKMVSAAKLRRSQDGIVANRPYAQEVGKMLRRVASVSPLAGTLPYFGIDTPPPAGARLLLVVLTSDRGLCGAFNSSIGKKVDRWVAENGTRYSSVSFAYVGRKGREYCVRRGRGESYYVEFGSHAKFLTAKGLTQWILGQFLERSVDEVKFVYNEFKNAISQTVVVENFLPIQPADVFEAVNAGDPALERAVVRPGADALLIKLLEKHFAVQVYRMFLESQASEHGARMSAMENATKNAGEMIRELTLVYNKQRQAAITKELLEITSGSEALK